MDANRDSEVIPLYEERARISKRVVEKSSAVLKIATHEHDEILSDQLLSEAFHVERLPVGRYVETAPEVRVEGDTTIYPVFEEVMVKRLLLREEVRVTPRRTVVPFEGAVTLRRQYATVETLPPSNAVDRHPSS